MAAAETPNSVQWWRVSLALIFNNMIRRVHLVNAMVFLMGMYGCESWTVKKAERRKIDALELWCWR